MATGSEFEELWRTVGVQIKAAMDPDRGWRETFLVEHARQAADLGVTFLKAIPDEVDVGLAAAVTGLGDRVFEHTRFLCGVAQLDALQAERLMAASREGYGWFLAAFRDVVGAEDSGLTIGEIVARIEAALSGPEPPPDGT